jgi:hypothetical protein
MLHGWPATMSRARPSELESGFLLRMGPFRHRRTRARLLGAAHIAVWSACFVALAAIAGLALVGLQSGV